MKQTDNAKYGTITIPYNVIKTGRIILCSFHSFTLLDKADVPKKVEVTDCNY